MSDRIIQADVAVLGSGPGGYTAAFRAADLGKKVVLIEQHEHMGGVCLNVGCIPSKALLHVAKVMDEAEALRHHGVNFGKPQVDVSQILAWKDGVVQQLTQGLRSLAKQRQVEVIHGVGQFTGPHDLSVTGAQITQVQFQHAVIAVGSSSVKLPFIPDDPRIITSTGALRLANVSGSMLVIGGGIIGLEMATVYSRFGAEVTVVELTEQLMPGADPDIVKPLAKRLAQQCHAIHLGTKVTQVDATDEGIEVTFEGRYQAEKQRFDQVLVAVGRTPNGHLIQADRAGVTVDQGGFIAVDEQMRTSVPHIFAIGDVVGQPMLAHKSIPEGKVAAEVIAGMKHVFAPKCIPSVAYTDPEVAWVGVTEEQAKQQGMTYDKGVFPWMANGRSLTQGRPEGMTKLLFDHNNRVIGAGIVGPHAGDLIAEVTLAIEMGCDAQDLALTIHPHPTLAETVAQAAEAFEGTITDLYMPKKT